MQFIALGYLIDQLTKAPVYLGLLGVSQAIPRLLFALVGGVAADRLDRRRMLVITNTVLMASAILLWLLAHTERIAVWHILVIGAFNSLTLSFDAPARQSLIPSLVGERELMQAVTLTSVAFNGAGIFGPSLGGVIIAVIGVKGCFLINALSFLAVFLALFLMEFTDTTSGGEKSVLDDMREGMQLLNQQRLLLAVLAMVAILSFFGRPYIRLMPAYAREVVHAGPAGLGVLQAAPSIGTVLAVFVVSALAGTVQKGRLVQVAILTTGGLVILFGLSPGVWVSFGLLVLIGLSQAIAQASANTLLQTAVLPHQRGRIMGLYNMVVFGMFALGTLPMGALGGVVGVGQALALGGAVVVVLVGLLAWRAPEVGKL
jgi:MFS family permease